MRCRRCRPGYASAPASSWCSTIAQRGCALSVEQELQVFHIVQEALANVAKHSHARRAWLRVEAGADRLEIVVEDDGEGLHADAAAGRSGAAHFGLEIMQERAQRLGGTLSIEPREGGGTRVRLCIPMRRRGAG